MNESPGALGPTSHPGPEIHRSLPDQWGSSFILHTSGVGEAHCFWRQPALSLGSCAGEKAPSRLGCCLPP